MKEESYIKYVLVVVKFLGQALLIKMCKLWHLVLLELSAILSTWCVFGGFVQPCFGENCDI